MLQLSCSKPGNPASVLYSAVFSPFDCSHLFTLHPLAALFILAPLGFSGKHSSQAAITHEDYSITFPKLSIARYLFIQLSALMSRREKKLLNFEMKLGSLDCESGILPLSYRASHIEARLDEVDKMKVYSGSHCQRTIVMCMCYL